MKLYVLGATAMILSASSMAETVAHTAYATATFSANSSLMAVATGTVHHREWIGQNQQVYLVGLRNSTSTEIPANDAAIKLSGTNSTWSYDSAKHQLTLTGQNDATNNKITLVFNQTGKFKYDEQDTNAMKLVYGSTIAPMQYTEMLTFVSPVDTKVNADEYKLKAEAILINK